MTEAKSYGRGAAATPAKSSELRYFSLTGDGLTSNDGLLGYLLCLVGCAFFFLSLVGCVFFSILRADRSVHFMYQLLVGAE